MALSRLGAAPLTAASGWRTLSAVPMAAVAKGAGASTSRTSMAMFTTTAHADAAAKGGSKGKATQNRQKQQKKKTTLHSSSAGARGGGARKGKRGGGGGSGSAETGLGFLRSSPYAQPLPSMSSLAEFLPENLTQANVDSVMAFSRQTLEATQEKTFGLPKALARQFVTEPRPKTLMRANTLKVLEMLDQAQASTSSAEQSTNTLVQAPIGFGVSTLLLQAFSYALESDWLVVYLPRSINFVDSSTPYTYSEAHQSYLQPDLTRNLLQRILLVNRETLAKIALAEESIALTDGKGSLEKGKTLDAIIQQAIRPDTSASTLHQTFEVVMRTIVQQTQVPVLLAIDGLQGLFSTSWYRDPDYRLLESYELSVPRTLQACLRRTGPGSFGGVRRGVALTAQSLDNKLWPSPRELRLALNLTPRVDAYESFNPTMRTLIEQCQFRTWDLADDVLTRRQAGALLDVKRREGGMWSLVNDETLMSKLVESGGNLAVFQRSLQGSLL